MTKEEEVETLYNGTMSTPCSCIVIHPRLRSMKNFEKAYSHIEDVFRFDETYPNCDFMRVSKDMPVLLIGPGDRMGLMAKNYSLASKVKNIKYLTRIAFYREYMESVTGRKFMPPHVQSLSDFLFSDHAPSYTCSSNYESSLRGKLDIIGFWPFSIEWAKWHGLHGVFCNDIILDLHSARQHGLKFITEDDIEAEQQRLVDMIKSFINLWPSHRQETGHVSPPIDYETDQTILAKHNNKHILVYFDDDAFHI